MPSPSERDSRLYLEDMRLFCERVIEYAKGVDREAFTGDTMRYDPTMRNLEPLGEAASRVPAEIRSAAPRIPWRQRIATRNRLVHAFLGIDDDIVRSIVRDDIPALHRELIELLATRPGTTP